MSEDGKNAADPKATVTTSQAVAKPARKAVGGFELIQKLGQGGMGAVFKARQPLLNRSIALKVMAPHLSANPAFVKRFIREACAAASLTHPNVVQVHTAGEDGGRYYIAMEFVEGESLQQRLKRAGAMAPAEAVAITLCVAEALDYAWKKAKLIHRDIKPDNIFLSTAGEVKLGDLGLAKNVGDDTAHVTATGVMMGTPHYMSPEQAQAEKALDFRSDMYSLGCTLFHMLAGRRPYTGDSALSVAMKHVNEATPSITQACPNCPHLLAKVVTRMMAKKPEERYASYEDLLAELKKVSAALPNDQKPGAAARAAPAQPNRILLYVATGVAAVLLVGGLFLWAPWRGTPANTSVTPADQPLARAAERPAVSPAVVVHAPPAAVVTSAPSAAPPPRIPPVGDTRGANGGAWTDLIGLIDPARDFRCGQWKIAGGALTSTEPSGWALCTIPAKDPGDNYDLRFRVTRGEGSPVGVFFLFRKGATGGYAVLDYYNFRSPIFADHLRRAVIESVRGADLTATAPARPEWLPKGRAVTVLVQVREAAVSVVVDGQEVVRWPAGWSQITQRQGVGRPLFDGVEEGPLLGVGIFNCQAVFHTIEMQRVSAAGPTGGVAPAPPSAAAGELKKLKADFESGAITKEVYDRKVEEILRGI